MALLDKLRNRKAATRQSATAAIRDGKRLYAVGDIHGRADLLERLLELIEHDAGETGGDVQLVFLGDYIDRGDHSRQVIDILLSKVPAGFETTFLLGNHEQALLDFLLDPLSMSSWLSFGGVQTLASYGVPPRLVSSEDDLVTLRDQLKENLPKAHLEFYESCVLCHAEGGYYFVHAGVRPGVPLKKQVFQDQLWIRDNFLRSTADHGAVVVHGHSITEQVEVRQNRIGIDTGAYTTGVLTALVLEGTGRRFLQTGTGHEPA